MTSPIQDAHPVIQRARLMGIHLREMEALTRISKPPADVNTHIEFKHVAGLQCPAAAGAFGVDACGELLVRPEGADDSDQPLVRIMMRFELKYQIPEDLQASSEAYEAFAKIHGPLHAWPYWRELIQGTLSRMGLPAVVLDLYRVPREQLVGEITQQAMDRTGEPMKDNGGRKSHASSKEGSK